MWYKPLRLMIVFKGVESFNPFSNDKILDTSKLKDFADENTEFDENG